MKSTESKPKKKRNVIVWILLFLILSIVSTAGFFIFRIWHELDTETEEGKQIRSEYAIDWSGRMNVLVIGCDEREHLNLGARADSLIVANLDLKNKAVRIMSIPRDLWVEIPGHDCYDKVNSTLNPNYFSDGGISLTLKTVENLLKIPVKLYVKVDFEAFKEVVDALGGIVYTVEKDMYYIDPSDPETVINLKMGEQKLDGDKALQYCRFRWDPQGDFVLDYQGKQYGRTSRQLNFVKELAKKVIQTGNLITLNSIINIVVKHTDTNIDSSELLRIALLFHKINPDENLHVVPFPGSLDWVSSTSVILPKEEVLQQLIETEWKDPAMEEDPIHKETPLDE
ncbi:MAG: LCP family protein [Caldisericia bacterium]|nr:LCP family protein [Caldisericia bacterium]MDD4614334.1 LCP family protein [Caldisericia bacterium]